jgi:ribosomal protein S6--L-glutamate ligase
MQKNITIITISPTSPGADALSEAAQHLGYVATTARPGSDAAATAINGNDAIIYRIGPSTYDNYQAMLPQLQRGAKRTLLAQSLVAFDKCQSYELLNQHHVAMPQSLIIRAVGDAPFLPGVLKTPRSNRGVGVVLIETAEQYKKHVTAELQASDECLYQEYIPESRGTDKRLLVVGDRVVAAMQRLAGPGEFRANLHLGGTAQAYAPTADEAALAVQAVRALGLHYGGVDILDSQRGPLVLEVNPSPGLAISTVTNTDVATAIITNEMEHAND